MALPAGSRCADVGYHLRWTDWQPGHGRRPSSRTCLECGYVHEWKRPTVS